ncbi:MAG: hypothetical protein AB8B39_05415 [Prochlorococcus sp.]
MCIGGGQAFVRHTPNFKTMANYNISDYTNAILDQEFLRIQELQAGSESVLPENDSSYRPITFNQLSTKPYSRVTPSLIE